MRLKDMLAVVENIEEHVRNCVLGHGEPFTFFYVEGLPEETKKKFGEEVQKQFNSWSKTWINPNLAEMKKMLVQEMERLGYKEAVA